MVEAMKVLFIGMLAVATWIPVIWLGMIAYQIVTTP
jgi:hypothetical protein